MHQSNQSSTDIKAHRFRGKGGPGTGVLSLVFGNTFAIDAFAHFKEQLTLSRAFSGFKEL